MTLTSGNNSIDSLAYSSWAAQPGTPITLTYSFMTQVPTNASTEDATGFAPMTATQQQAVRAAMALWASVANIDFVQVVANGNIQLGTNDQSAQDSAGYAYIPDAHTDSVSLYLNNTYSPNSNFTPASYGPVVLLHELGHTLGLKHPGNYDSTGNPTPGPYLPTATDDQDYSVMSYNAPSSNKLNGGYETTPMLYDIQAMQYLYGANMSYHAGDDHYVFTPNTPDQCIWDAGGTDVFDFSGCTAASVINLRAGGFSTTAPGLYNVSIAYNVVIEQAIAGSGGSTIYANNAGDTITGGIGNDVIYEGAGNDHITGGGGTDTVMFNGSLSKYQISAVGSTLTVHGDGTDVLTGISTLGFSDGNVSVKALPTLAQALPEQDMAVGTALHVNLGAGFSDPGDSAVMHYTASLVGGAALPDWLALDATTGTFSGTPTAAGVYNVQLNAIGSLVASDDFTLVVGAPGTVINGTGGNDVLTAGPGDDTINGGAGIDTVVYSGSVNDHTVTVNKDGTVTVSDKVGTGGIDTLQGIERLQFADGGLALDVNGETGQLYRLYGAMYSRTPDAGGLGFWLDQLDHGVSLTTVANYFITSPEYVRTYGSAVSDADFVTSLYSNVLHRAPDPSGFAFQLSAISSGVTRAQMLVDFSESPENIATITGVIPAALAFTPVHG